MTYKLIVNSSPEPPPPPPSLAPKGARSVVEAEVMYLHDMTLPIGGGHHFHHGLIVITPIVFCNFK